MIDRSLMPNRNKNVRITAVFALFFAAPIVHLLAMNLKSGGSFWDCLADISRRRELQRDVSSAEESFRAAAQDRNLAIHFHGFDPGDLTPSRIYYRAVYSIYPRKVFIGKGEDVINSSATLHAADILPDDRWLRAHDVGGVFEADLHAGVMRIERRGIARE